MLPAPKLDDRNFQQLVDEAKRYVQQRCPEWTDHNVSDPGVTLIETFAWMTDILLYRLNRVTDRTHTKFLDLIGVRRFPPAAARVDVEFRLSAPQEEVIVVPAGAEVATRRTITEPSVSFTLLDDLRILPAGIAQVGSSVAGRFSLIGDRLGEAKAVECFADTPQVDDALYLGFDKAVPAHTVLLSFACELGGHGIDPDAPPLAWEAWTGAWTPCELIRDETGGFNRTGKVELYVPDGHMEGSIDDHRHGWIRCRVTDGRPAYESSPRILDASGVTIGARGPTVHATVHTRETVGVSEGVAGQHFQVEHTPVLPGAEPLLLHVRSPKIAGGGDDDDEQQDGTDEADWVTDVWDLRPDFADSTREDRHFTLDATSGTIHFGPLVRMADGNHRQHGAIPPKGAVITVRRYRSGGGATGNVAAGAISVLRSSIPMVASVSNRQAARGGVDGETVAEAKERGPIQLRTRNRAVTTEDFEALAREAAPEIARVRCALEEEGPHAGAVRVLIVPAVHGTGGRVSLLDLDPDEEVGERIAAYLDERRLIGTRIVVGPPGYVGLHISATLVAQPRTDSSRVQRRSTEALFSYFHPVLGGADGKGWPFGRAARLAEVLGVLQTQSGVDVVESASLELSHAVSGDRLGSRDRIDLGPTNLVLVTGVDLTVSI